MSKALILHDNNVEKLLINCQKNHCSINKRIKFYFFV